MPLTVSRPAVLDDHGANLDPRNCDCGKGNACPLITPAWRAYLADQGINLDSWGGSWSNVSGFAVVDLRDGFVVTRDADNKPFLTQAEAEAHARLRNHGLLVAAQTWRVIALEPVLFAEVKP